jgi:6-pyruvoyltetrahydropterin/6-carboxytetrahydropterin synthase
MRVYLSRRYSFSASHRLYSTSLDDHQNAATFGKDANPFGHGHNYVVQVTFSGPVDPITGVVFNVADLDSFTERQILARFDHTNFDSVSPFASQPASSENFAMLLAEIFRGFPFASLVRLRLEETPKNAFDIVDGPGE